MASEICMATEPGPPAPSTTSRAPCAASRVAHAANALTNDAARMLPFMTWPPFGGCQRRGRCGRPASAQVPGLYCRCRITSGLAAAAEAVIPGGADRAALLVPRRHRAHLDGAEQRERGIGHAEAHVAAQIGH